MSLKRMAIITAGILILGLMIAGYFQQVKIQKLETKLLLEKVNENQAKIIKVVVPKYINEMAPLPADKAKLGDILYGGE